MRHFFTRVRRVATWLFLETVFLAGALVLSVGADTSPAVRTVPVSTCYCACASSKSSAGCSRMCELPKYASHWWAISCTKSRTTTPAENPGAGPHLPHPARAERASR